ncbi:hypothetical protein THAOC_11795, partial [Thalassiosira oceanica]
PPGEGHVAPQGKNCAASALSSRRLRLLRLRAPAAQFLDADFSSSCHIYGPLSPSGVLRPALRALSAVSLRSAPTSLPWELHSKICRRGQLETCISFPERGPAANVSWAAELVEVVGMGPKVASRDRLVELGTPPARAAPVLRPSSTFSPAGRPASPAPPGPTPRTRTWTPPFPSPRKVASRDPPVELYQSDPSIDERRRQRRLVL